MCVTVLIFRYKKNLKALFIVHPTGFIKVIWNVLKQFVRLVLTFKSCNMQLSKR
jgi:hypothetical protein